MGMKASPMSNPVSDYLYADEAEVVQALERSLPWDEERRQRVRNRAVAIVHAIRKGDRKPGEMESFLRHYSLDTEEGLALMALAEALLRIPDPKTANALIHDKVAAANWLDAVGGSGDWMVKAAGLGLMVSRKT